MKAAPAFLVGAMAAVACAVALAFAMDGLDRTAAILAWGFGGLAGWAVFRQIKKTDPVRPSIADWILAGIFALSSLRSFLWLIVSHDDSILIQSRYNLGDLALHIDLIRYLASGIPFWPESPILTGEPLKYPIGSDLFNSLLLLAGIPVERGLIWTGLAGAALTGYALWCWGRAFAIAAFLFAGGLAGFVMLGTLFRSGQLVITDYQADMEWKNLFLTMFVTQRGLLFALPAGLLLLDDWRREFLRGQPACLPRWAGLLLYATLPLYSVHTFLFLSIVLLGIFLFAGSRELRVRTVRYVALAFIPAAVAAALVTGNFAAGGGIHLQPGWMQEGNPFRFWIWNFGITLPLWLVLIAIVAVRGDRESRSVVIPASFLFLVCCFVSFAKWPWDNMKIMMWCWIAIAPWLWQRIFVPLPLLARASLCFVLFFSGAVSLAGGLVAGGIELATRSEIDATAAAIRQIDPAARFAASPEYNHPLLLLGRKVALGYDGHLWSHGLDYESKMLKLEDLLDGMPGWEKQARELEVDYLFWGPREDQRYAGSPDDRLSKLPVAAQGEDFTIFDLRHLSSAGTDR